VLVTALTCTALLFALLYNSDDNTNAAGVSDGRGGAIRAADSGRAEAIVSLAYDAGEDTEFCLYRSYIIKCTRDSFYIMNKRGEELFKKNIEFQKPSLTCSGNFLLAYDIGGRTAFVIEDRAVKWEEKLANNIVSASINKDGYMAIVTEASGYRNSVSIMAPIGRKLFDRVVADDYVISAQISDDNKQIMLNRIKTSGISVRSGLEFIDIRSEPFAAIESEEEKIFLTARYLADNSFSVVTESGFKLYHDSKEIAAQESFDAVFALCEFPAGNCAVAAQQDGEFIVFGFGAKKQKSIILKTEAPILNMSSTGDNLVINTGQQVIIVGSNGKLKNSVYSEAEILYTGIYDKTDILVVTERMAELYKIG